MAAFQSAISLQNGLDQALYLEGKNYPWLSNGSSNSFINHVIGRYCLDNILNCPWTAYVYSAKFSALTFLNLYGGELFFVLCLILNGTSHHSKK